jgi:hypothetical protein
VKVISLDAEAALEELHRAVARLASERPEIERVVLFGSLAEGRAGPASDADLLIVLRSCDRPYPERITDYLLPECPLPADVFPYTQEEIRQMLGERNAFLQHALSSGRTIWPPPVPAAGSGKI